MIKWVLLACCFVVLALAIGGIKPHNSKLDAYVALGGAMFVTAYVLMLFDSTSYVVVVFILANVVYLCLPVPTGKKVKSYPSYCNVRILVFKRPDFFIIFTDGPSKYCFAPCVTLLHRHRHGWTQINVKHAVTCGCSP